MAGLPLYEQGARLIRGEDINAITNYLNSPNSQLGVADNGTTQTLTVAMIAPPNAIEVYHTSTGGATPTLTTPTAAQIIASQPNWVQGQGYYLRMLNLNSGTATLAGGTGVTITGTATLATNTSRDFIVTYTSAILQTVTFTNVGSGTV